MKGQRRYAFAAGAVDFYVLAIVLGAIAAFYVAATRHPVPLWEPFLTLALSLVAVVVYHVGLARKCPFRSAGEVVLGRVFIDGLKQWRNPYGVSRGLLFAVLFAALVGAGNSWDSVADERFYATLTFPVVLGRVALVACLLAGVVFTGAGQPKAGFLVVAYLALGAVGTYSSPPPEGVSEGITRGLGIFGLAMAVVTALVVVRYHRCVAEQSHALDAQKTRASDG